MNYLDLSPPIPASITSKDTSQILLKPFRSCYTSCVMSSIEIFRPRQSFNDQVFDLLEEGSDGEFASTGSTNDLDAVAFGDVEIGLFENGSFRAFGIELDVSKSNGIYEVRLMCAPDSSVSVSSFSSRSKLLVA